MITAFNRNPFGRFGDFKHVDGQNTCFPLGTQLFPWSDLPNKESYSFSGEEHRNLQQKQSRWNGTVTTKKKE
jgi:hypothetical protein